MLKLHIFLVDTGIMFTFDMEMALESVGKLMEAIFMTTQIPVGKQVLMIANGEPLNPSSRVASYKSAGTETNPIFLFSKSAIESPQPPVSRSPIGTELSLEQQVEKCLQLPPIIETIVSRAKLASEFHLTARELGEVCENLVGDQQLQQQGWQAVVSNLDNIATALNNHVAVFQEHFEKFLSTREQYLDMLERFDDVISLLSRIPVLPCLPKQSGMSASNEIYLLAWINSKEQKTSLESLVVQCKELLLQFDSQVLGNLMNEVNKVLECSENESMKDIKGLDERLLSLQQRLTLAQQLVQEQADMAQGFKQNQMRAEYIGDRSVLPDLCASHRKQLVVLAKNHKQLRDICALCTRAKDELSTNLHARLRWVMVVEHSICNCDSKLLVFHESLRKMKRRLEVLEQVYEAPRMYVLAVLEILRRKSFSSQFLEWGRNVSLSSAEARTEEIEKRSKFSQVFGNHFLHSLFTGLDDNPSYFAESPPSIFDEMLPEVDVNDIRLLQAEVPELLLELSLGDSLEQSSYVRERLSQTNLTKLCDPNSNPKLVETLRLRELTGNHGISKMTVSQLHKEISQEDMPIDIAQKPIDWQLGDITMGISGGDFEPSSLKTLPSELEGLQSSQSSEISDSMFRSAEGLDERLENSPGEVVGVLELSEEPVAQQEEDLTSQLIDSSAENSANHSAADNVDGKKVIAEERQSNVSPFLALPSSDLKKECIHALDCTEQFRLDLDDLKSVVCTSKSDWYFLSRDFSKAVSRLLSQHDMNLQEEKKVEETRRLSSKYIEEKWKAIDHMNKELTSTRDKVFELEERNGLFVKEMEDLKTEWSKKEEDLKYVISALEIENANSKSHLASENQKVFDTVMIEMKNKGVAAQRQWERKIEILQKEMTAKDDIVEKLRCENLHLQDANSSLTVKLEKCQSEKEKYAERLKSEVDKNLIDTEKLIEKNVHEKEAERKEWTKKLEEERATIQNVMEKERMQLKIEFDSKLLEMKRKFEEEKFEMLEIFEKEKSILKEGSCSEKIKLIEDFKKQRISLREELEKEKLEFRSILEKEKSAMIRSCELEKQKYAEDFEIRQSLTKTSSIEEGIDALEWEKLLLKLKDIEEENKFLKEERKSREESPLQKELEALKMIIHKKDEDLILLKERMKKLQVFVNDPSSPENQEKICFRQFKANDLVMLCYDEQRSNYTILTCEDTKYFLHPDSKVPLNLNTDNPSQIREWLLAYITDQEYCVAKKVQNRFKLPVGTYFYRIHARPWHT